METQHLTGLHKRRQIAKAGKTMFLWVALAAIVVSIALVTLQFFYQQFSSNSKVLSAKYKASSQLSSNKDNIEALRQNIDKLVGDQYLTSSRNTANEDNLQVILDALPSRSDATSFATSVQQVIAPQSGVTLESVSAPTDEMPTSEDQPAPSSSEPVEQQFNFVVTGSYDATQKFIQNLEKTIRPTHIRMVTITGSGSSLRTTIDLTTYYQPSKSVEVTTKAVE